MKCRYFFVSILLLVVGINETTHAQSQSGVSKQIWIDVNPSYFINPHFEIFGDIGARKEIENDGWWRFVVRPSIRTWLGGRFYLTAGIGNFFTFNEIIENRWELRPFQGLEFNWPRWKTPLHHYIRLEERFDFNTETWNSKNSVRLRYRLNISYRWGAHQPGRFWQATASGEAFYTLLGEQGQFQEQARATLGLDRSFAYDLHFRMEITWQQERLFFNTNESISDIYFRIRFNKAWGNMD
jgi:hypothetical protein